MNGCGYLAPRTQSHTPVVAYLRGVVFQHVVSRGDDVLTYVARKGLLRGKNMRERNSMFVRHNSRRAQLKAPRPFPVLSDRGHDHGHTRHAGTRRSPSRNKELSDATEEGPGATGHKTVLLLHRHTLPAPPPLSPPPVHTAQAGFRVDAHNSERKRAQKAENRSSGNQGKSGTQCNITRDRCHCQS